jgi:PemK-like, MazF-like toxin of type II toxin-antitoxin system
MRETPYQAGDVLLADLDPVAGHEQGGRRPVLVLSGSSYNELRNEQQPGTLRNPGRHPEPSNELPPRLVAPRRKGRVLLAQGDADVIAFDFGFHGNSAGNRLLSFRDHGPGRGGRDKPDGTGVVWPARRRVALRERHCGVDGHISRVGEVTGRSE